ncbi:helix-turn-helix domain-containing protein [Sphingomicrobium sediminis]|uniref:AraC family transcriptional regulator n=1 Tax=Sphingomicrobium sediminis TaxID=2950949 RepID=A0A9X2EKJ3_9SPHN|nr:AraC family transcriptional regulator [Sphingomicrobium sediminis]MCM8557054.1 AraC family transcriptional regulator [Sphingomicrobium sediminis]
MNTRSGVLGLLMLFCLIVLIYLRGRRIERPAIAWLSLLILAGVIELIPMLIGFAGAYNIWPGLTFLPTQVALLTGPLLFLHARALIVGGKPGRWLWLLAPGAAYWLYQLWAFTMLGDYRAKWAFNDAVHVPYVVPAVFVGILVLLLFGIVATWRLYRRYRDWLDNNRADGIEFDAVWVRHLIILVAVAGLIWLGGELAYFFMEWGYERAFIVDMILLGLLGMVGLEALVRLQAPYPKMGGSQAMTTEDTSPARDWRQEGERIREAVREGGWYLEPGLSLDDVTRRAASNSTYVSRSINEGLGVNFSELVNGLRVDHAKQQMRTSGQTILEIALDSGFGSKASFNRVFRDLTGQTPSQYRRSSD